MTNQEIIEIVRKRQHELILGTYKTFKILDSHIYVYWFKNEPKYLYLVEDFGNGMIYHKNVHIEGYNGKTLGGIKIEI